MAVGKHEDNNSGRCGACVTGTACLMSKSAHFFGNGQANEQQKKHKRRKLSINHFSGRDSAPLNENTVQIASSFDVIKTFFLGQDLLHVFSTEFLAHAACTWRARVV